MTNFKNLNITIFIVMVNILSTGCISTPSRKGSDIEDVHVGLSDTRNSTTHIAPPDRFDAVEPNWGEVATSREIALSSIDSHGDAIRQLVILAISSTTAVNEDVALQRLDRDIKETEESIRILHKFRDARLRIEKQR